MLTRRELIASTSAAIASSTIAATADSEAPLRIAQIGLQGHYDQVLPHIPTTPNCKLVAVARSMPDERIEDLQKEKAWNRETRIFDDYKKMLDEIKPDVVAVFMPYTFNGQADIEAVRRGCHVISEKPVADRLEELDTLRSEVKKTGVKLTTLLVTRLVQPFAAARKVVADGLIGEPLLINAQKSYKWGQNRPEFYKDRKLYGGTITWIGIHAIDFMRYVSGMDFAEVTARQAVKVHTDFPGCEDIGALLFELANGGQATLSFDYLRPPKSPSHGDDRLRIVGTKGIVEARDAGEAWCEVTIGNEPPRRLALPPEQSLFKQFIAHIRGGPEPIVTAEDAYRSTELAIRCRQAADTRSTVRLDGKPDSPEAVAALQAYLAEKNKHDIYDEHADAKKEIAAACDRAGKESKNVLLMYGGNWCVWCHRLNYLLETDPQLSKAIKDNYVLLHIDSRNNKRIMIEYNTEAEGVPYFTVLSPDNKVIRNQETGVFEMGSKGYDIRKVLKFLMDYRSGATTTSPAK